jgi:hypothetical protein
MSQPPGQFGGPYGPPGAYGPPPYGSPGGPPAYGAPPPRNNVLPWLIVGAAVLLSGLGLLLVFLLTSDGEPSPAAAPAPTAASSTSAPAPPTRPTEAGGLLGGATAGGSPDAVDVASPGRYEGSADVALAWVQAMADGDFEAAFAGSCAEVQQAAADADDGSGPAWTLGTYFFEVTLDGVGFTEGTFDGLVHDAASASDVATFTLYLDSGEAFVLLVYVGADLTVCDFR